MWSEIWSHEVGSYSLLILRVVYSISTASGNKNENKRIHVKEQRYVQMAELNKQKKKVLISLCINEISK